MFKQEAESKLKYLQCQDKEERDRMAASYKEEMDKLKKSSKEDAEKKQATINFLTKKLEEMKEAMRLSQEKYQQEMFVANREHQAYTEDLKQAH